MTEIGWVDADLEAGKVIEVGVYRSDQSASKTSETTARLVPWHGAMSPMQNRARGKKEHENKA